MRTTFSDPDLGRLREESFAETEGEPTVVREAKAIAHHYRNRGLVIRDGELIVGSGPCFEVHSEDVVPDQGTVRRAFAAPSELPESIGLLFAEGLLAAAGNHTTTDYGTILSVGFHGLIEQIQRRRSRLSPSDEDHEDKLNFLDALRIVAAGYVDLCVRHADHAVALSRGCGDESRKRELETIAQNCRTVPGHPPNSFWEACQNIWSSFYFLPDAPGRVDQYLYPFYAQDMDRGTITRDLAKELLSCLWIKYFEQCGPDDLVSARNHLTLGGVNAEGGDASNEVTYLCLEVTEELRLLRPQVGLRWNRNAPPELLSRAAQVLRSRTGHPSFCSDEQIVPALINVGIKPEDARDFTLSGCNEVIVSGKSQMGSVEGFINMPMILRLVLGLEPVLRENRDLSAICSYDELWDEITDAMDTVASAAHEYSVERDAGAADSPGGNLAASLVTKDCIENCRGYTQGGARYNNCNWDAVGVANLADSLAVLRKLVFEERAMSLDQLAEALRSDWDGHESLRRRILTHYPHFGNDEDDVDEVAAQIVEVLATTLKRRTPFRGGEYTLGTLAGAENMQIEFGRKTGATPDGRHAGEPLADSLAAAQGRDRNGVTAMLNSVAKIPHSYLPTSTTVNVKLDPRLLATDAGVDKVAALVSAHFMSGGQQLQFNFHTREMLLQARENPEKHANLMVRVAGYSAPFVSLWDDLQDEIISRTEHGL